MPRDVVLGEGYEGGFQTTEYARPNYEVDPGTTVLRHEADNGLGFGYGSSFGGMDDVAASFAAMFAAGALDKLRKGLSNTQDALIATISSRNEAFNGYQKAKALYDDAVGRWGPAFVPGPMGISLPNAKVLMAYVALATADQAVKFIAKQIHASEQAQIVFSQIQSALMKGGLNVDADMIGTSLYGINRFNLETGSMFGGVKPYTDTISKLTDEAKAERAAWGVPLSAYDDPRWYEAYLKASDRIVPMPKSAGGGGGGVSGLGTLGFDPISIAIAIGLLLISIGVMVAVIKSAAALTPNANAKAETARALILQREADWTKIESQMRAQNKSQEEIDAARKQWDAGTKKQTENIPDPPSLLGSLLGPLGIAAAALVVGFVATRSS